MSAFFGKLLSTVAGSFLSKKVGGGQTAPSPMDQGSLNPSSLPDQQNVAPPSKQTIASVKSSNPVVGSVLEDLGQVARKAFVGRLNAKVDGSNLSEFNNAAFPGTTPWEQLGGSGNGAAVQASMQGAELKQRDKESIRASDTTLMAQRIQAGSTIAREMLAQGGTANAPVAAKILRETGVLGPTFNPADMAKGKIEAELGYLDAQTYERYKQGDKHVTDAQANTLDSLTRKGHLIIETWKTQNSGRFANELRSMTSLANDVINSVFKSFEKGETITEQDFTARLEQELIKRNGYEKPKTKRKGRNRRAE